MSSVRDLNDRLFSAVNHFAMQTPWLHGVVTAFAKYGVVLFALALLTGVLYARHDSARTLAAAGWAGIGTLVAVAVNQPIGNAIHEQRPYVAHPHALLLVSHSTDFSFPSDHAVMAGAVAAGLFVVSRKLGIVAAVAAVMMAAARVYVGAHYPGDVIAGLVVGAVVSWLGWLSLGSLLTRLADALRASLLRPLLSSTPSRR